MGKVLLGGVVGGVIVFLWGAFTHMATPLGTMGMQSIPNEDSVLVPMKLAIQEPGLYFFPGMDHGKTPTESERKAWEAKAKAGPAGLLVVTPSGGGAMSPRQLLVELGSNIAAALLASYLLTQVTGTYFARVRFLALIALFGWVSILVSYWNWYAFPTDFIAAAGLEEVVGWALAGLALAAIVKPAGVGEKVEAEPAAV